jgi:ABC-type glycerol-3-phosphate transport system substrate-binding protein
MQRVRCRFSAASRRRRSPRLWLAVPVAVVAALSLALVAGATTHAGGSLEVVSFYPEGSPDYDNLVSIDKSFSAAHGGADVKLVFGGGQNAPNIQARWRAGNPPEVNVGFFGPGSVGHQYVDAGQVYDLTSAMKQTLPRSYGYGKNTKWKDSILPAVRRWLTLNGHYYAVPREITAVNFFYNRAIFDKYKLKAPKTWAEFLAVCAKLKQNGVTPLTVTGTFAGYMQMYYDYLLARRSGVTPVAQAIAGKRAFSSVPGANAAASDLQNLVAKGYFMNGFQGTDFTSAQLNFFQGKAAMILMGTWLEGEMKDSIPDGFELGTFPFPQVPGGKGNQVLFGSVNSMTVAKQSQNPQLGVDWLKWFSRKDVQSARVKYLSSISGFKGVKVGPKYKGIIDSLQKGGSFATSYFGVYTEPQSVRDAYQQPIVKLFFGKIGAGELVNEISNGLKSAQR